MNGHWLSGTRKLNKHYQSGNGGGGLKTFTYRDMQWPIHGFEYDAPDGYDAKEDGYYNVTSDNIEFAPVYKIFNSAYPSTPVSTETRYVLYSKYWRYDNGYYKKAISSSDVIRGQYPVWYYGEFRGDPYWAYSTRNEYDPSAGIMGWGKVIRNNGGTGANQINQDGIYYYQTQWGDYFPSGSYPGHRFEDIYNGKTLKVLIPVFDLIAIPNLMNVAYDYRPGVDITDEEDPAEPAILKLKYNGSRPNRVYSIDDWSYRFNMVDDINANISEYFNLTSGFQLGTMGGFCENLYTILGAFNPQGVRRITAGYASGQEMVYAIRLKWLEVEEVDPTTKIVFTGY